MSNLTRKRKNDKVSHSDKFSITDIVQIIRGDLKYGYADISIRNIGDGYFEISKWNLGGSK